jgi:hypothetical protein
MKKQDDVTFFGYHVVCLIDVLGQNQKLARWATLPDDGRLSSEFIQDLKQTAGTVLAFRDGFINFFYQLDQCTMPGAFAALPTEQQARYARFKECRVRVERLSDTFVFSSLIPNIYGDASISPLYRLLSACCMAMMWSLAAKAPVRGSITVGAGAELEDGSFYGPALAEAHYLESKVAGYPRVVVSPTVLAFLAEGQVYSTDPQIVKVMEQVARICRAFICQDTDGRWIVDFLGKGMRELHSPDTAMADWVKMAYDFVCSELARFRAIGDSKLAERYGQLQEYIESRLPVWGIQS